MSGQSFKEFVVSYLIDYHGYDKRYETYQLMEACAEADMINLKVPELIEILDAYLKK